MLHINGDYTKNTNHQKNQKQIFETFKTVQHLFIYFTKFVPQLCHTFTCTRRIKNKEQMKDTSKLWDDKKKLH